MCGVIGLVAAPQGQVAPNGPVGGVWSGAPDIIDEAANSLGLLLYRGYDSVGLAVGWPDGRVRVSKMRAEGEDPHLRLLAKVRREIKLAGGGGGARPVVAIGHSRWATHGPATAANAHPHTDCRGEIALVHNGIIENVPEIKSFLERRGSCRGAGHYQSETDTEVAAHLIGYWRRAGQDLRRGVASAVKMLKGSFAFLIIDAKTPGVLVAVKRGSPLLLGVRDLGLSVAKADDGVAPGGAAGRDASASSSAAWSHDDASVQGRPSAVPGATLAPDDAAAQDIAAVSSAEPLAKYGYQKVRPLLDDELVVIRPGGYAHGVSFYRIGGQAVTPPKLDLLRVKSSLADKGSNDTFFVKEINEQPAAAATVVNSHYDEQGWQARLGGFDNWSKAQLKKIERVFLVAEGTSLHAAQIGAGLLRRYAKLDVTAHLASEFGMDLPKFAPPRSLFIVISQSGETADVRVAAEEIDRRGGRLFGLVNVVGSSIARLVGERGGGMYTHAGPEISVASSKVYTAQLSQLAVITLFFARNVRATMPRADAQAWIKAHKNLPAYISRTLKLWSGIKSWAQMLAGAERGILFIGRGDNLVTAREGALKLRELSYLNAVAYSAGEMKHGTIALIDKNFPTVAIALADDYYEKMIGNIQEIKARGGPILAVATKGDQKIRELADLVVEIPESHPVLAPILAAIPLQMLAYYVAKAKGHRIDRPRNLAKSVTVA